jgi:hypothetical protein
VCEVEIQTVIVAEILARIGYVLRNLILVTEFKNKKVLGFWKLCIMIVFDTEFKILTASVDIVKMVQYTT